MRRTFILGIMKFLIIMFSVMLLAACGGSGDSSDAGTDVQTKALLGQACEQDSDCEQGWCQDDGIGDYCTNTCTSDEVCESQSNDGRPMCCVASIEHESLCEKIGEGGQCGDRSGTCGDSCTGGLNSLCATDYFCFASLPSDPKAICSMPCETDQDCDSCSGDCIVCMTVSGGDKICLPCLTK